MGISDVRVIVHVDTSKVVNMLDNYIMVFTRNLKMGMQNIARLYARTYRKHIQQAGIEPWTGKTNQILMEQEMNPHKSRAKSKTSFGRGQMRHLGIQVPGYMVVVPGYMVALDRLRQPFVVTLYPERSITKWYKEKISGETQHQYRSKKTGRFGNIVYKRMKIKRHPWIDSSNAEVRNYLVGILENVKNKTRSEVKT